MVLTDFEKKIESKQSLKENVGPSKKKTSHDPEKFKRPPEI